MGGRGTLLADAAAQAASTTAEQGRATAGLAAAQAAAGSHAAGGQRLLSGVACLLCVSALVAPKWLVDAPEN